MERRVNTLLEWSGSSLSCWRNNPWRLHLQLFTQVFCRINDWSKSKEYGWNFPAKSWKVPTGTGSRGGWTNFIMGTDDNAPMRRRELATWTMMLVAVVFGFLTNWDDSPISFLMLSLNELQLGTDTPGTNELTFSSSKFKSSVVVVYRNFLSSAEPIGDWFSK